MAGRRTRRVRVTRVRPGQEPRTRELHLLVEEALELRVDGELLVTLARTPGDDWDLATGYLLATGLIQRREDLVQLRYCAGADEFGTNSYNVLDAALTPGAAPAPPVAPAPVATAVLVTLPAALDAARQLPGAAAAALADTLTGELLVVRQDVHARNAVDKCLGWGLREERLAGSVLVSVARADAELVARVVTAGIRVLVAPDPTSLAVEAALAAGLVLASVVDGELVLCT